MISISQQPREPSELFVERLHRISNGIEFRIGLVDTLASMHCQLEFEFLPPRVEELHEVEQFRIPNRAQQDLRQQSLLHVGIAKIRTRLDIICSAFNEWLQWILDVSPVSRDHFVIFHIFQATRCECATLDRMKHGQKQNAHHILHSNVHHCNHLLVVVVTLLLERVYRLERQNDD